MKLSKNVWKRSFTAILFTGLIAAIFLVPVAGSAEEPEDGAYTMADIDEPPRVIRAVPPKYPFEAKEEKLEGRVVVELIVTKDGIPCEERVIDAEPPDVFEAAALETIEQYEFAPAKKNGIAVDVRVRIPIKFELGEECLLDPEAKARLGSAYKYPEVDQLPRVLESAMPEYPANAKKDRIEGKVVVRFVVDIDGIAKEAEIVKAEPESVFNEAALKAVSLYRFEPALMNGAPVPCIVNMPVVFKPDPDAENNVST